jgi:lauroyl/myristoyl acyltransferase
VRAAWLREGFDTAAVAATRPHPPAGFRAVARLARLANRLQVHGPRPSEVARLFPEASVQACAAAARQISANHLRNHALVALVQRDGIDAVAAWTRWESGGEELLDRGQSRQSAVLVTWHVGAALGIGAALHGLGAPVLFLRAGSFFPSTPVVRILTTDGPAEHRAAAGRRALDWLRAGGLVLAALDGSDGEGSARVPCLGRAITIARGPLALARLASAPLVPLVARWRPDGRVGARAFPALPWPTPPRDAGAEFETALAAATAAWLEGYLREAPGEMWPSSLRWLLDAPPLVAR